MRTLDERLQELRRVPADARLACLEAAVMKGLDRHRQRQMSRRHLLLAASFALAFGVGVGALPGTGTLAAAETGLFAAPALAPSQLLGR